MSSLSFSAETVRRIALLEQEIDRLKTRDAGSGVSAGDHGSLTGLSDDDHPQYGALAQNETVTGLWTLDPVGGGAPLVIAAGAADALVDGLNADQVDGIEGAALVQTSRQVNTGDGLNGGGALSSDLTLTVDVSDFAGVGLEDDGSNNLKVKLGATNPGLQFDGANALELGTPGTLSVSTGNTKGGTSHQHAITSSSNPGAAQSLLASDTNGYVQLERVGVGIAPAVPLHVKQALEVRIRQEVSSTRYADFILDGDGNFEIDVVGGLESFLFSGLSITLDASPVNIPQLLRHSGDADTYLEFTTNQIDLYAGNNNSLRLTSTALNIRSDLVVTRGGSDYTGYIYVPMTTPTTVYSGTTFSTVGTSTQITAATLGIPSNAKGVLLEMAVSDSGGANNYFAVGPTSSSFFAIQARTQVTGVLLHNSGMIPTDGSGNVYYRCLASGTNTLTVYLRVWGYFI